MPRSLLFVSSFYVPFYSVHLQSSHPQSQVAFSFLFSAVSSPVPSLFRADLLDSIALANSLIKPENSFLTEVLHAWIFEGFQYSPSVFLDVVRDRDLVVFFVVTPEEPCCCSRRNK
jgi:hypothetical protein